MSSITFPHGASTSQSSHQDMADSQYYSSQFDGSSGFQMNPLSSHPPRTPRVSAVSSHMYNSSVYEKDELSSNLDAESIDEEEDVRMKEAERRIRHEEVWREIVLTSNGRDKAFKIIQYSIKVYLLFHISVTGSRLLRKSSKQHWEQELVKRLTSAASGLSFSRKCLLLFNWLSPLTAVLAQQSVPFSSNNTASKESQVPRPFLHAVLNAPPPVLLELVNAISDDLYTLSLLGILSKRSGDRAARLSDWCWFFATLVGLVENGVERQMNGNLQHEAQSRLYKDSLSGATAKSKPTSTKVDDKELARLQKQDYWLQLTRAKLMMDLIFVSYDIFRLKRARDSVKAFTGLIAAILSTAKLFDRHKSALTKALGVTL
ncbi:hypothetical protein J3R30DRAFT_3298800 [Lentinula aciculospora]|uniref:Peroxisomal biogenesis factor 11 n=1 Tax=Lentinula aciculospora TaxID=153920 RepID=A0A9W9DJE3_9AGAR|nr:hypothetical protein J3R30DRAFT_3298800 [Lentinula aciculospora]